MNLQARVSGSVLAGALLSTSATIQPLLHHSEPLKRMIGGEIVLAKALAREVISNLREIERGHQLANLLDTAIAAGTFKTLVRAIEVAGLVETLSSGGPFTMFGPTDSAFAKLSADQLGLLLKDRQKLTALLKYHLVPGWLTTRDAAKLETARTLQGQEVKIKVNGGGVTVNSANVTIANAVASNGIIHAIDTVMSPDRVAASAAAAAAASTSSGAAAI